MNNSNTLQWISAIGSIITPILIAIVGAVLARVASRQEKVLEMQAKLQDDRIAIYNTILEPYIIALTPEGLLNKNKRFRGKAPGDAASEIITTTEYKNAEFKLLLIGSDGVVKAYNEIKKFFYQNKMDGTEEATKQMLRIQAQLILEIRKSVGNEGTKISQMDAIWWFVKDADKVFKES
ncbi:MAG: hypothetical protein PVF83_05850 [Anaerolineales bacterium]|jgi:hypothetical protein